MEPKKVIPWVVGGLLVLFLILFGVTAAGTASEAGQIDNQMKAAVSAHTPKDQVKQQLTALGHTVDSESPTELKTTGPRHSMVVYSTVLKVRMGFDQDGKTIEYHMDRQ